MAPARAFSILAAMRQLGQSPASERHEAQIGLPQPLHGATDGTA
jgi:hypothetical protein